MQVTHRHLAGTAGLAYYTNDLMIFPFQNGAQHLPHHAIGTGHQNLHRTLPRVLTQRALAVSKLADSA